MSMFSDVQFLPEMTDWEEAVMTVSKPLLERGYILPSYQQAMIQNIKKLGSYMILMPGVAMPHSRPEDGVKTTSTSLLVLEKPVMFPDEQPAWFIICLAAASSDKHMDFIESIADLLGDDEKLENIQKATSVEQIISLL